MPLHRFSAPTRRWFEETFDAPTVAQERGWDAIARGDHTLIHAPTGSGKTLAAFLWAIDRLAQAPLPDERERCRVLYVSPMKALAYDIERNLQAPLAGIVRAASDLGREPIRITTAMRTGDTSSSERRALLRHPPDILITTPESLYLMLTSRAREVLRTVRWVVVDEIHAVAGTKRGSHLALSLERLEGVADVAPQRIGLSATQRPLEAIGAFLAGGIALDDGAWDPRPVTIVDARQGTELDIEIVVPVEDMTRPEATTMPGDATGPDDPSRRSIWPAVYPRLVELVRSHTSTLLFVNARGAAERLAAEINRLAGEELVRSHHGSVAREQRIEIETLLKRGELRGVVATSTLELGIDMAAIDLVVLVESPSSVASGLQRVGRAGHSVGTPSSARVFPKHRGDLLEAAVVVERMYAGAIEETRIPQNPLDVLAQHIVASVAVDPQHVDELFAVVRGASPFRHLPRSVFDETLDMLAGRYPSDEFAELRPRIVWDRHTGTITPRGNAKMLAVTNAGTIPDRGLYTIVLPEGGKVGELDEEMVYESRAGDVFVLGSTSWRIQEITQDRVIVAPAAGGASARMPFWHGDGPGRPVELGRAVGAFLRTVGFLDRSEAERVLAERYRLDGWAAANLATFFEDEREATGVLPTDCVIVIERFRDEVGDWRTVLLSPFGGRVHAPWALAAKRRYRERHGIVADVIWSDDGIVFHFPDADDPPPLSEVVISPEDLEDLVLEEVGDSALFTSHFRESAARALLLPRRRPGTRTPLWLQRRKAASLLAVAKRFASFPIVLETYREVLEDYFDVPALRAILGDLERREIRVETRDLAGPSPFATSLMLDFVAAFMYEYDAPVAEKRAAALTLDRSLLRELLGDPQFRDLLDADVIDAVEQELQRRAHGRRVDGPDALHDALRDLGPLSEAAIRERATDPSASAVWLARLIDSRRAVVTAVDGEERAVAVEDVARLRDALGVEPPAGVAPELLEPVPDPLGDVVGRFARTRGPFTAEAAAAGTGLPVAIVTEVLRRLEAESRVASGAYRPGGEGVEWVDLGVLQRLRRRSLAVLRSEVEAVGPERLGIFLPAWHGIDSRTPQPGRLLATIRKLQGFALPASTLERDILAARGANVPADLDELIASGAVVWTGRGALGASDGRIALYLRDEMAALHWDAGDESPDGLLHDRIRTHLTERGASFFADLYAAAGGGDPGATVTALWDLVWAGEVTNDTLGPLRAYLAGSRTASRSRRPNLPSAAPPAGSGRWSLVGDIGDGGAPQTPEQTAKARAEQLLERHGVVTRPAALAEGVPGGFAGLFAVFTAMEDAGRVRRGYFVDGCGGAQFGLPGAVERLRSAERPGIVVMSSVDPANPFGAAIPWPDAPSGRPARRAGSHVILYDGRPIALVERGGRAVTTFGQDPPLGAIAAGLADLLATRYPRLTVETVDARRAASSALAGELEAVGFVPGYKGLTGARRGTIPERG